MRPHERSAVRDRRVRARHLDRRHRDAVADRHGADRGSRPLIERKREARRLAREVDSGALPEAEAVDPRCEAPLAEALRDRDRADVRGVLDDLPYGHALRSPRVRLADRAVGDLERRRQHERRARIHDPLLQTRRDGHELEGRSGLVGVGDRPVAAPIRARRREAVRVEPRRRRHGEDRTRLRIHHDRGRRLRRPASHRLGENLLGVPLNLPVEREANVVTGRLGLRLDDIEGAAERILHDRLATRLACKSALERSLEALQPLVVEARVAEDLRRDGALRVVAKLLRVEPEPGVAELLELLGLARIGLPRDVDEPARAVGQRRIQLGGVRARGACPPKA